MRSDVRCLRAETKADGRRLKAEILRGERYERIRRFGKSKV